MGVPHLGALFRVADRLGEVDVFERALLEGIELLPRGHLLVAEREPHVRVDVFGVGVQDPVRVVDRLLEIAVLDEDVHALGEGLDARQRRGRHRLRLPPAGAPATVSRRYGGRAAGGSAPVGVGPLGRLETSLDIADQVLHAARAREIQPLDAPELGGQLARGHPLEHGEEGQVPVLVAEGEVAGPLVPHPGGLEVLLARADRDHDPGAVEGGEDMGLEGAAEHALEGLAAVEDAEAVLPQRVVDVPGDHAVLGAPVRGVAFLVADEDVVGLVLGRDLGDAPLDLGDLGGLALVDVALRVLRALERLPVVGVRRDALGLHAVDRGDHVVRARVLDVDDAVAAQGERPVGLGVPGVLVEDLAEQLRRAVELVRAAQLVAALEQPGALPVVQARKRLGAVAVVAGHHRRSGLDLEARSAVLAFKDGHSYPLSRLSILVEPAQGVALGQPRGQERLGPLQLLQALLVRAPGGGGERRLVGLVRLSHAIIGGSDYRARNWVAKAQRLRNTAGRCDRGGICLT